jgi:16S rRNA (adenine1518-N6/adenine1519-N6)-dimethyltransferase
MSSAGEEPLAWSEAKARLSAAGFRPSRRLGQNFLLDDNLARALVRDAGVQPGDHVLEVGPGLGFLTGPLLDAGAEVLAVEIDGRLYELLLESLGGSSRLRVVHADALARKHQLAPEVQALLPASGPWRLVANLPYSVSAPLLVVLSELENPPTSMSVLVQLEVAERVCAAAGSGDWGPLSARLQAAYEVRLGREVGPGMFWPRPKVESAVAHLSLRPEAASEEGRARRRELSELVAGLFQRRRQALGRVLGDLAGDREGALALLSELGIEPGIRAETLALEVLEALSGSELWARRARKS